MAKASVKPTGTRIAIAVSATLELIASEVGATIRETTSLSQTLGDLTRTAYKEVAKKPEQLDPFIDLCAQFCASYDLTEGSFKVYLSNMRGVLRAMLQGYKPVADATLRAMYDAAPKGTGRQKATGARNSTPPASTAKDVESDGDDAPETGKAVNAVNTVSRADAIRALFGHADDELDAALSWAASNEMLFLNYVKASIQAAQATTAPASTKSRKAAKVAQAA